MKNITTLYIIKGSFYGEILLNTADFKELNKAFSLMSDMRFEIGQDFFIVDPFGNDVHCKVKNVDFSFFKEPKKDKSGIKYLAEVFIWVDISDNADYQMALLMS